MSSQINKQTTCTPLPILYILDNRALICSSCALFTVYPTPLQVITTRPREGGPKEQRANQKWQRVTHSVTYATKLSTLSHLRAASTVIALLPKAIFTPSIQPTSYPPSTYYYLLLLKPAAQAQAGKTKLFINCFRNPTSTCATENKTKTHLREAING